MIQRAHGFPADRWGDLCRVLLEADRGDLLADVMALGDAFAAAQNLIRDLGVSVLDVAPNGDHACFVAANFTHLTPAQWDAVRAAQK